jgi:sporulation protein YlmC with PRC-barrel domain
MVKSAKELQGLSIEAKDGTIGGIYDIYFDDHTWRIQYVVVDTSKWLPGRKVLIATEALHRPWHDCRGLAVDLTREQVKGSPDIDTTRTVEREAEMLLFQHYGWVPYWAGALAPPPPPAALAPGDQMSDALTGGEHMVEGRLHSVRGIIGYRLNATDERAGTVDDILIDPEESRVRYMAVITGELLSRKKVLVAAQQISRIDWAESAVFVSMSRHAVECSPCAENEWSVSH